jgi:hypothetical protein
MDDDQYLCVYEGLNTDGWSNILTVDTDTWLVAADTASEYDTQRGYTPTVARIDDNDTRYLCVYQGSNNDGWAVILNTAKPVLP